MNTSKRNRSRIILFLLILATAITSYAGLFGLTVGDYRAKTFGEVIIKGLDLKGGTSVLLEVQAENLDAAGLERVRELVNMRVNSTGAVDATITTEGSKRIRVDIPGEYQTKELVETLSKTGNLTFKDSEGKVVLEGKDIEMASAGVDEFGKYVVNLKMKPEGVKKFGDATTANLGKVISINMDDEALSKPTVNTAILNGQAQITGSQTESEARMLASMINNGALPYPVKAISVKNVGATLGTSVLPNVKIAGILGLVGIFFVMLYFYRIPGLIAFLALVIFCLGLLFLTYGLKISMSLAGIAGFLLSVGMAVDANVLIFERTKEELKAGIEIKKAIKAGFSHAMSSILDANITTLISGFILYYVGSGTVRGFALNLILGVVLSMFTAVLVTRFIVNLAYNAGLLNSLKAFGVTGKPERSFNFPFFKSRNKFFIASILVIGIGLGTGIVRGPNMGIDFAGGTQVTISFGDKAINKPEVDNLLKKYDESIVTSVNDGNTLEVRSQHLDTIKFDPVIEELKTQYGLTDASVQSIDEIGAAIGSEQTKKAVFASVLSVLAILAYVAVRFNFSLGVGAIVALVHDVLFTLAMYFLFRIPINSPFIAAILTIIGYSINDTVVIFDRIRENLGMRGSRNLEDVTDKSISQTMVRTINTSLTVFIILILMYFLVPQIREFTLPLLLGVISGVYSTVFIASPIYVMIENKLKGKLGKGNTAPVKQAATVNVPKSNAEEAPVQVKASAQNIKQKAEKTGKAYSNKYGKKEKAPVRREDPYAYKIKVQDPVEAEAEVNTEVTEITENIDGSTDL